MDEEMLEGVAVGSDGQSSTRLIPEVKMREGALQGGGGSGPKVVFYKDKLLKLNGNGGQAEEEEDWNSKQKREEEEADLLEGLGQARDDDPLCPRYTFSIEEHKKDCEQWRKALIIKIMGKRIGMRFLMARLQRIWNLVSTYEVIDLDNGFLLLRFQDDGDYRHVFEEGPWIVNDHYVVVQRWRPFFDPYDESVTKLAVWVRISGLPIELYTVRHLWRIGNIFGRILKVDRNSLRKSEYGDAVITERARFAIICIEVDLRMSLLSKFTIGKKVYQAGYEGLHLICFNCRMYGHRKDLFPAAQAPCALQVEGNSGLETKLNSAIGKEAKEVDPEEAFGSWMVVHRKSRSRRLKARPASPKKEVVLDQKSKSNLVIPSSCVKTNNPGGDSRNDGLADQSDNSPSGVVLEVNGKKEELESKSDGGGGNERKLKEQASRVQRVKTNSKGIGSKNLPSENQPPNSLVVGSQKLTSRNKGSEGGVLQPMHEFHSNVPGKSKGDGSMNLVKSGISIQNEMEGVRKREFPALIRDIKYKFNIKVLVLLETKIQGDKGDTIIKKLGFPKFFKQEVVGFSGGIWVLWDSRDVEYKRWELVTFVYGSPRRIERMSLWEELEFLAGSINSPWVILGDFNYVLNVAEKYEGEEVCYRSVQEMQECLEVCGLSDIGYKGPIFTWKRGSLQERIDRAVANEDWNLALPNRKCWGKDVDWLVSSKDFEEEATRWHHDIFREEMRQKHIIYARIQGLDMQLEARYDRELERLQRDLWKKLEKILLREELNWFQRSRINWLKFGDKNSQFFHSSTVARRRFNKVVAIRNEVGDWTSDIKEMVEIAVKYFEKLSLAEGDGYE
ncbi:uncharacterized protein LOC133299159 [Gastrolobium bilobum]|uniref:uncharacterized protein LOC133299159 n=1 Tax=Gastrolobium bilobum TaxID=150636 RepID=UPI002AB30890|nr:uncharacterized protein LOC133299159 [Gastrolobium bilobum]